ncbi:MAG: prolipoprotein diacylglyceryl transferase [Chloroflexota bacterium]
MVSVDNTGITLLTLTLHWSALFAVLGVWIAAEVAARLATRDRQNPAHVWRGLVWVVLCGLIGGRLWFVLFPPDSVVDNGLTAVWLLSHFFDLNQGAVALWVGGLGLIGAMIGGVIGLLIYTRRRKLPFLYWLDLAAIVLPLAQAIGRLGNGANQDLYGPPTNLFWGMLVSDKAQRVGPYRDLTRYPLDTTRFHPVYFYEMILLAAIFVVLLTIFVRYRERFGAGDIVLLYVTSYGMGRFLLEFLRVNVSHMGNLNISQAVIGLAALAALIVLLRRANVNRPFRQKPEENSQ